MKVCIDLFAGLGGFSAAFEDSDEWTVLTVDVDPEFAPDVTADVMDLTPTGLLDVLDADRDEIDVLVVLASPPCTQFSLAASRYERFIDGEPQTADAREAITLVYHTIGIIKALSPDYWYLENPQGYLRQVLGSPTGRVTYCQYGTGYMKPTDLWGVHPPPLRLPDVFIRRRMSREEHRPGQRRPRQLPRYRLVEPRPVRAVKSPERTIGEYQGGRRGGRRGITTDSDRTRRGRAMSDVPWRTP